MTDGEATRPIDAAMAEDRPEKLALRAMWADLVEEAATRGQAEGSSPLYFTLPGGEGKDIELLIDRSVIEVTATRAIRDPAPPRVVAVEYDSRAIARLQDKFPGLTIVEKKVEDMLGGIGPLAWPGHEDRKYCRAHVVNLDFNSALKARDVGGQWVFPVVAVIAKFAQLHTAPPMDWKLCLTVNARIGWAAEAATSAQQYLRENFEASPDFAEGCRGLLGQRLFDEIREARADLVTLSEELQQAFLMTFVPKRISQDVLPQGWRVTVDLNVRYGSPPQQQPMVSWVLSFRWDTRTSGARQAVYKESLASMFVRAGTIAEDGTIH